MKALATAKFIHHYYYSDLKISSCSSILSITFAFDFNHHLDGQPPDLTEIYAVSVIVTIQKTLTALGAFFPSQNAPVL